MNKKTPKNFDDYVSPFPKEVQQLLRTMRVTTRKAAPGGKETMSYGIPTPTFHGNLVHFAAYKSHIGFYPGAAIAAFKKELSKYKGAKGSVQFPLDKPLPLALVRRIVKFRVNQRLRKLGKRKKVAAAGAPPREPRNRHCAARLSAAHIPEDKRWARSRSTRF